MCHGLTQKQLGALTKMSASFIGEVERGLKAPNLEGIVAIALGPPRQRRGDGGRV
jgi:transcriptional regulator with XRE-family HTH domain